MNKEIMRAAGLGAAVAAFEAGLCPECLNQVNHVPFRDELSQDESGISGLCQPCQDQAFDEQ